MKFIRFLQADPNYEVRKATVIVSEAQIVRIEPEYYTTDKEGRRWLTQVTEYGQEELMAGVQRDYIVWDSLGGRYTSESASEADRAYLEKLWRDAA